MIMIKLITTVGTSFITNNLEVGTIKEHFNSLKNQRFEENNRRADKLKTELKKINANSNTICAEIDSIKKIAAELKEDIEVYLIATDTILSPICAEFIRDYFKNQQVKYISDVHFDYNKNYIIENLQVKSKSDFEKEGLSNLFIRIRQIAGGYWANCILNITGGYKALIPYMSIIAQVNRIPAYYNFQETKDENFDLLRIPNIPINIDYALFEKYWDELNLIADEGISPENYQLERDLESIVEKDNQSMYLTSLGYALWEKYKESFFVFYCPDEVFTEFNKQEDIKRIFSTKFHSKIERASKVKSEQQHKTVFKDGNNNNRIYYFEKEDMVYVYKTLENHSLHEKFLLTSFNEQIRNDIVKNSKPRKIKIVY